jgi:two-component system, OmpR family, sensor histidine kinase MprB
MKLRTKLGLLLSMLTLLTAASVGTFAYVSTENELNRDVNQTLKRAATTLVQNQDLFAKATAAQPLLIDPLAIGIYSAEGRASLLGVRAQIIDREGSIIAISPAGGLPLSPLLSNIDREQVEGNAVLYTVSDGEEVWRIRSVETEIGHIEVGESLTILRGNLNSLRERITIVVLSAAMLAFILGVLATAGFLRRLERMTTQVSQIAQTGVLVEMPQAHGRDEISVLTRAFNRMTERLALSRNTRERLVQDTGHEIKTPLTSLTTNIQVLRTFTNLSDHQRAQLLEDLDHEATTLSALISELLDASADPETIEASAREPFDLVQMVESVVQRSRRRYAREIPFTAPPFSVEVEGVERLIRRAVENVMDNAVKYSPHSRPIEVEIESSPSHALVRVRDHGPGLPDAENVFLRRWRGASDVPGSGLGLAIVRDVIEGHGGTVAARNRHDGGAEFMLLLPIVKSG